MAKPVRHPVLRNLRHRAEYLAARLVSMVFQSFPVDANLVTARLIGNVWYRLVRRHRERAETHVRDSFPGLPQAEVRRLARESMVHLVQFAMEMLFTPRLITPTTWHRYVTLGDLRQPLGLLLAGKPLVMLAGHYGNWELLGYTLACLGFEVNAVMRPLDNPYLNRWVEDVRARRGLILLHKRGVSVTADQLLVPREPDGRVVAFIADQDAGKKGLFVPFFGRPASTYKSIGLLAIQNDAPVIIGYARRTARDRFAYEIGVNRVILPEEWKNQPDELRWLTEEYTKAIEDFVRLDPSQYLWVHRRWKHQPKAKAAS